MAIPFANLADMWSLLINPRLGAVYVWGGFFDPVDHTAGADCSGCAGMAIASLQQGLNVVFQHYIDTMDFTGLQPGQTGPMGIVIVGSLAEIPPDAAVQVSILQGDTPEDSHMIVAVPSTVNADGSYGAYVNIESGGDENCLAIGSGATQMNDPEFNQWGYLPGPIQPPAAPTPLTQQQLYAQTIIATGESMGITPLGCQMALACGLTESSMQMYANSNVPASLGLPHDAVGSNGQSCGIFQQQAQDGWGTVACEMDVACSAGLFFNALTNEPYNSGALPPWQYIQNVQRSAFADGSNYQAQWNAALALYNSVITAPPPGGFLMALTDAQQTQIFNAICAPVASQSPFRQLGESTVWEPSSFWGNDDGFEHPQYIMWAASLGDPVSLAVLNEVANADVTQYPDRIEDAKLAQQVLARIAANPAVPVVPSPAPAPTPAPVPGPTPSPVPSPVPAPGTITTAQLAQWGKDLISILGALGTWATAAHNILGQYLNGATATVVPVALAVTTAGLTAHTIRQRKAAEKGLMR